LEPEHLVGTPFQQEYASLAPNPGDWPALIEKIKDLDRNMVEWSPEDVQAIQAPMLLVIGDSDIVRPEHAVEIFRLVGGGVNGDIEGMPRSRLAILPGTSHITVAYRGDWLRPM